MLDCGRVRLEEQGQPYLAVHFGLEKDVLAHDGCAELFQVLFLHVKIICMPRKPRTLVFFLLILWDFFVDFSSLSHRLHHSSLDILTL